MKPLNLTLPKNTQEFYSSQSFKVYCKDAESDSEPAELLIMDQIGEDFFGDGVSPQNVIGFLNNNKGRPVNVRINSPGGLVYDGLVMYNNLLAHDGEVTATIEGLAYSAASFLAMAADKIRMYEASDIGIHYAWGGGIGNKEVLRDAANWLESIDDHLLNIFESRTGQDRNQLAEWMGGDVDGTLFSARDAVEYGFADEVIGTPKKKKGAQRQQNLSRIQNEKHAQILAKAEFERARTRARLMEIEENA